MDTARFIFINPRHANAGGSVEIGRSTGNRRLREHLSEVRFSRRHIACPFEGLLRAQTGGGAPDRRWWMSKVQGYVASIDWS
jgi:hypothetical protein